MSDLSETQKYAAEQVTHSLVLTAGAGAGKTRVLVSRFLNLLQSGFAMDQIVAITFTRKAAAEMRERVGQDLRRSLAETTNPMILEQLTSLLLLLPTANITTIHGFCSSLLRSNPLEAGIDPNFSVLEEWQSSRMLQEAMRSAFEQTLQSKASGLDLLLLQHSPYQLSEELCNFYQQMRNKGVALQILADPTATTPADSEKIRQDFTAAVALLRSGKPQFDQRGTAVLKSWQQLMERLQEFSQVEPATTAFEAIAALMQDTIDLCNDLTAAGKAKPSKNLLVSDQLIRESNLIPLLNQLYESWLQPYYTSLIHLLQKADDYFTQAKTKAAALDFADLEAKSLQLLQEQPQILSQLQRHYQAFLIDEFQDTNYGQYAFISLLNNTSLERSLFIAGDAQQSIYGFRGAIVQLFSRLSGEIETALKPQRLPGHKHLHTNYRSGEKIISLINAFFTTLMPNYEPMTAARQLPPEAVQLELLLLSGGSSDAFRLSEADTLAVRLRKMVDQKEQLVWQRQADGNETAQAVTYADIALLFRSRTSMAYYEAAFRRQNIPYLVLGNRSFYQRREIEDILLCLAAVAHPADEFTLWGWLNVPVNNLPANSLAEHVLYCRKNNQTWLQSNWFGPRESTVPWQSAWHHLINWRLLQGHVDLVTLLQRIRRDVQWETYFAGIPDGEQALANLWKFESLVSDACGLEFNGLEECLHYFHQLAEEENEGELTLFEEGQNAVRLMTIHAAKGLEFPVLVLPDLIRRQEMPVRDLLLWHPELGLTFANGTLRSQEIKAQLQQEDKEEALRVLYVAFTRARDYLVLCGGEPNRPEASSWWQLLADWLGKENLRAAACNTEESLTLQEHRFRVTRAEVPKEDDSESEENQTSDSSADETSANDVGQICCLSDPAATQNAVAVPTAFTPTAMQNEIAIISRPLVKFSATTLLHYQRCPRSYFLRYRLWLKEPKPGFHETDSTAWQAGRADRREEEGNDSVNVELIGSNVSYDPLRFGSFMHRLCELLTPETDSLLLLDQVLAEPNYILEAAHRELAQTLIQELQNQASYQEIYRQPQVNTLREWPFTVLLAPGFLLQGIVDFLAEQEDGSWHLVDYKTNRINASQAQPVAESYYLQLQLYCLAVEKLTGKPVSSAQLAFIQPGIWWDVACDATTLAKARQEAIALAAAIEQNVDAADFQKCSRENCHACEYASLCNWESK